LASIHRLEPPANAQAEGWARLSAQIAVVMVGTAHGTAAAASVAQGGAAAAQGAAAASAASSTAASLMPAAFKILSSKLAVALAMGGVAVGASAVWVERHKHSAPPPAPVAAQQVQAPVSAQLAAALPAEPDPALQLVPDSDPGKQSPIADQRRRDMLSAESALITQARAQLRNGDANAAQQLLRTLHKKFPKGMLRQEREVLAIEVLAARGNADAARQRARAFIAAHPESPHSAQLNRFADAP
ncbi:MAG TPA: tetratricopeptide repeat protein, partial [Polyangiaceae bacterium]|nr:tetratricopeptide repeat protein [Polyangiaceae bacterium]